MTAFRTILHPTDFSVRSRQAFSAACASRATRRRLIVLHVIRPPAMANGEPADQREHQAYRRFNRTVLDSIHATDGSGHANIEHRLEEGDPAEVILAVAGLTGCDLIVMGTHGRTGLTHLLTGSVAEAVLRARTAR